MIDHQFTVTLGEEPLNELAACRLSTVGNDWFRKQQLQIFISGEDGRHEKMLREALKIDGLLMSARLGTRLLFTIRGNEQSAIQTNIDQITKDIRKALFK